MKTLPILICLALGVSAATRTISPAATNYSATTSWVEGAVPTSSDDVVATASSGNLTITATAAANTVDLTGYVGLLRQNAFTWTISGGTFRLSSGMTYTSAFGATVFFAGTGTVNITLSGKSLRNAMFNSHTGAFHTKDAFSVSNDVYLRDGNLSTDNQTWNIGGFDSASQTGPTEDTGPTRTFNAGSSTINIAGGVDTAGWDTYYAGNLTLNMGTSLLHFLSSRGIHLLGLPSGATVYDVEFDGITPGVGDYVYIDCCSRMAPMSLHKVTFHGPLSVVFAGNDIWSFDSIVWDTSATRRIALMSDDQPDLNIPACGGMGSELVIMSSPNNTSSDYLDICRVTAQGGGHWFAGTHSTQPDTPNDGWTFTVPPTWIQP